MSPIRLLQWYLFAVLASAAANVTAVDDYNLLMQGARAKQAGDVDGAVAYYTHYIANHPLAPDAVPKRHIHNTQYYLRNLIIAYTNLHEVYRGAGREEAAAGVTGDLVALRDSGRLGSKNAYKVALFLIDEGMTDTAESILQQILSDQRTSPLPHNNKVVLRSYAKLLELHRQAGNGEAFRQMLSRLKTDYPSAYCDANDKYTLAHLLLEHGQGSDRAVELLHEVHDEYIRTFDEAGRTAALRAFVKLVKEYSRQGEKHRLAALVKKAARSSAFDNLSTNDRYRFGATIVNYSRMQEGVDILEGIVDREPYSTPAKKALFTLGRHAQAGTRWDDAIRYYGDYIERFPDAGFFTLKAYSRLLDAHFSRDGYSEFLEDEMQSFADIVSDMADYEAVLNLSRDMKWKGWDKLADASFSIGLAKANAQIRRTKGTVDELRARWIVEKYAYALERAEVMDDNARAILSLAEALADEPMPKSARTKLHYIKGQTRLWLAKKAEDEGELEQLESQLQAFIAENPNDPDIDYAWYHLGKAHEARNARADALRCYRKAEKGVWKDKAKNRLRELENDA